MRRVAYLVFQSHQRGSYLHDGEVSISSGRLKQAGFESDVFEVVFHHQDTKQNERLLDELARQLHEGRHGLLVVHRIWDAEVIWSLRRRLEALHEGSKGPQFHVLFMPRKRFGEDFGPYDFVSQGSSQLAIELLAGAADPIDPDPIPGLLYKNEEGAFVASANQDLPPIEQEDLWTLRPDFKRIRLNPDAVPNSTSLVVYGNPGCPYRKSIREVPVWENLKLDEELTNTKGCAFCNINLAEDYRFVKGIATHVIEQIQNIQEGAPDTELIVLLDQDPFPFLPELFEKARDQGLPRFHLLIQARADLFLKRKTAFEKALSLAREGNHGMTPFLIGIENFHQETLDFYNKGVTVEMNIQVLNYLRDVADRFQGVYDPIHVSPGFILWHPWVSFESLRTNVNAIQEHGLTEFRSEIALSKIRLYPDIPFYWKAKEDGLLEKDYAAEGFDSSNRYGYPEEAPYRFFHPEAQSAFTLLAALVERYEPIHELKLLSMILGWVERNPDQCAHEPLPALTEPADFIARFEEQHHEQIEGLKKDNSRSTKAQGLSQNHLKELKELVHPVWMQGTRLPGAFSLARVLGDPDKIQLFFAASGREAQVRQNPMDAAFRVLLEPRSNAPHFRQSTRYNLSYAAEEETKEIQRAIHAMCAHIMKRDRGVA
jgi:radical SAM superfamily enzyme YgiQ (UPF0313 family)